MNNLRIALSFILFPLSILYGLGIYIRNKLFDFGILPSKSFDIPIIGIGNITVGGTGKTPHVEYLVELLKDEFKTATLSRGYKRKTSGFVLAGENSKVKDIGDEPMQIKTKNPDITVAVDNKRVHGIKKLKNTIKDLDLVLLDDAYQHRYVKPNLNILLIDYNHPINKDFLLPLGNLREPVYQKRRANIIIFTKAPYDFQPIQRRVILNKLKPFPYQTIYFTTLEYGKPQAIYPHVAGHEVFKNISQDTSILLVTGIADPRPLKKYLENNLSKQINSVIFADHRNYSDADINKIEKKFKQIENKDKVIITTEKDAIRFRENKNIPDELAKAFCFIPIKVKFLNNRTNDFNQQITDYVRKNKKHSFLYPE